MTAGWRNVRIRLAESRRPRRIGDNLLLMVGLTVALWFAVVVVLRMLLW
jgi:hypothetical protein